jgi:hypothetical protein
MFICTSSLHSVQMNRRCWRLLREMMAMQKKKTFN